MGYRLNWLPALVFFVFGGIFLYASFQIQSFGGGNGGRLIPTATSALLLILSAILLGLHKRKSKLSVDSASVNSASTDSDILAREFLLYSGPLIGLMAVYAIFHSWFGYLSATFLCGFVAFRLFGNTWLGSLIHAVIGTAILYSVFISLLNVYDPPGRVFDVNGFINVLFQGR